MGHRNAADLLIEPNQPRLREVLKHAVLGIKDFLH